MKVLKAIWFILRSIYAIINFFLAELSGGGGKLFGLFIQDLRRKTIQY